MYERNRGGIIDGVGSRAASTRQAQAQRIVEVVADALKWEPSRNGVLFPHLYRSLKFDETVDVTDLELDTKGRHIFPRLR